MNVDLLIFPPGSVNFASCMLKLYYLMHIGLNFYVLLMNGIFHDYIVTLLICFLCVTYRVLEKYLEQYLSIHMTLSQCDFDSLH